MYIRFFFIMRYNSRYIIIIDAKFNFSFKVNNIFYVLNIRVYVNGYEFINNSVINYQSAMGIHAL